MASPRILDDWGEATGDIGGDFVYADDCQETRRVLSGNVLLPILRNAGNKVNGWRYGTAAGLTYLKVFLD